MDDAMADPGAAALAPASHRRDYGAVAPPRPTMLEPGNPTLEEGPEKKDNAFLSTYGLDMLLCLNACFVVPERTSVVQLFFGRYVGTIDEPGCYCRNACLVELRHVPRSMITVDLRHTKVADKRGSPLMVSGIVTYHIENARRAAIDVESPIAFVSAQAPAVLKRVVAQYPYESAEDEPSLRSDAGEIGNIMAEALQSRVQVAGVRIESFAINELSYAPEIAQSMLKRQQAGALIEARQRIVQGATEIAKSAIRDSEELLTSTDKSKLLSNLLVVLVSDKDATPVVSLT